MSAKVHGDDRVPVLIGHVEQHPVPGDTGIVDHDVEPAEVLGTGDEFIGGASRADVTGHRDGLGAGASDLIEHV